MPTVSYTFDDTTKNFFLHELEVIPPVGSNAKYIETFHGSLSYPQGTWGMAIMTGGTIELDIHGGNFNDDGAGAQILSMSVDAGAFVLPDVTIHSNTFVTLSWNIPDGAPRLCSFMAGGYFDHVKFTYGTVFLRITGSAPNLVVSKDWTYPGDLTKSVTDTPLYPPGGSDTRNVYRRPWVFLPDGSHTSSTPTGEATTADWLECWIHCTDDAVLISVDGAEPYLLGSIGFPVDDFPTGTPPGKYAWKLNITGVHTVYATSARPGSLLAIGGLFNGSLAKPVGVPRFTTFGDSIEEGFPGTQAGMVCGTILPPRIGYIGSPSGISALGIETYEPFMEGILAIRDDATADDVALIALGHNDGNNWSSDKHTAYFSMLTQLFAKGYGRVIARGVFPDNTGTPADWNVVNAGIQAMVDDWNTANPDKPVKFEDTSSWLGISMIAPHPGWVGQNQMATLSLPFMRTNGFTTNSPTSATITGAASAPLNTAVTLTVNFNFPAWQDEVVTLTEDSNGTLTPATVTIPINQKSATTTYRGLTVGGRTITADPTSDLITGSTKAISITPQTLSMTAPDEILQYVESANFAVSINGVPVGPITVTPSDNGAGGTFHPASFQLTSAQQSAVFTYTAATQDLITFSLANNGSATNPAPITRTATVQAPRTDINLASWPADLTAKIPITGFSVTDNAPAIAMPIDPSARRRLKADFKLPLETAKLTGIERVQVSDEDGSLGIIVGRGVNRPSLDATNGGVSFVLLVDPTYQQNMAFLVGHTAHVTIRCGISGVSDEAIEYTVPVLLKQL